MIEEHHEYEEAEWQPPKRPLWWRITKSLLIVGITFGVLAFAALPLAQS